MEDGGILSHDYCNGRGAGVGIGDGDQARGEGECDETLR